MSLGNWKVVLLGACRWGFRASKAQTLAQKSLRQIHLEDGRQTKGHTPSREANGHADGYRACGGRIRWISERAAALVLTVQQPCISGVGPNFDHCDPLASVRRGW